VEGQEVPETEPVQEIDIPLGNMPSQADKPAQGDGKEEGGDRIKTEYNNVHKEKPIPFCKIKQPAAESLLLKKELRKSKNDKFMVFFEKVD
jgi:hypothetical protein